MKKVCSCHSYSISTGLSFLVPQQCGPCPKIPFSCPLESDEAEQTSSDVVVSKQRIPPAPAPFTNITNLPIHHQHQHNDEVAYPSSNTSVPLHPPDIRGRTPDPPSRHRRSRPQVEQPSMESHCEEIAPTPPPPQRFPPQETIPFETNVHQPRLNPYSARKTNTNPSTRGTSSAASISSSIHPESKSKQPVSNPYSTQPTPSSKQVHYYNETEKETRTRHLKRNADEKKATSSSPRKNSTISVPIDLTSPTSTNASISSISTSSISKGKSNKNPSFQSSHHPNMESPRSNSALEKQISTPVKKKTIADSPVQLLNMSPTILSEPVSFHELKSILRKAFSDPSMYDQYKRRTFLVPSKYSKRQKDKTNGFTLEKNKNYKKKINSEEKVRSISHIKLLCLHLSLDEFSITIAWCVNLQVRMKLTVISLFNWHMRY